MERFDHVPHDLEPTPTQKELQDELDELFAESDRQIALIFARYLKGKGEQ
jgi:hypothetical protein